MLREYLDIFCTAYIDDILIYSSSLKEHREHVSKILEKLKAAGLQVDVTKYKFDVEEVPYLNLIVSKNGVRMDPEKVKAIKKWETPKNVKDIQAFLGFVNFIDALLKIFLK